jgi:hypothetical protein
LSQETLIDFSNSVSKNVISQLAEADSENHNVVQQIQEVYADFQAINSDLFDLDIPLDKSLSIIVNQPSQWTLQD